METSLDLSLPPEDGKSQRVTAYGVCVVNDEILLVRASTLTEVPGRWFLPGGGVDHGEHPKEALHREVREETGLHATVGPLLGVLSDVRTRKNGVLHHTIRLIYRLEEATGTITSETGGSSDLATWVSLEEARSLPLAQYVQRAAALMGLDL